LSGTSGLWASTDPYALAEQAAKRFADLTGVASHDVAVVFGTGLAEAASALGADASSHPVRELPGFPDALVSHQRSEVRSVEVGGQRVMAFLGRLHLYEGYSPSQVAHPIRCAVASGCDVIVLTNASGAVRQGLSPGEVVLIADHLNLTGASPLAATSKVPEGLSPFVDLVDTWSPRLRLLVKDLAPETSEGVYAQLRGPHFETPAEIQMLRAMGADLVGMSSVLEAIAARQLGAEVLGLSLVTNLAAGMEPQGVSPGAIVQVAEYSALDVGNLIRRVIQRLR
jgi:purine-nucleoside phosphorylase